MLVLENTIFTFNQFPTNNVGEYDDSFDPTLMDDYTQNSYTFTADKVDYDDICPSPGIVETTTTTTNEEESTSPVRRHRFSICKANDPQAIIAYRRLSNACSSIVPSPNTAINQSYPSTPYIPTTHLFDDKKEDRKISSIDEKESSTLNLENSLFLNASTSCPNILSSQTESMSPRSRMSPTDKVFKEYSSPFHTILSPTTFRPILTPDQIIDNVENNSGKDIDEQFRLFNYVEEEDDDLDDDSLPSALNSCTQLYNIKDSYNDIPMLNPDLRLNSSNNIRNSEIVTSNHPMYIQERKRIENDRVKGEEKNEEDDENYQLSIEKVRQRAELESKIIKSIEKAKAEKKIKTYSQNVQGLYNLWKDNLGIGFKSILRE